VVSVVDFVHACFLISMLLYCLGMAFKFVDKDYVTKVVIFLFSFFLTLWGFSNKFLVAIFILHLLFGPLLGSVYDVQNIVLIIPPPPLICMKKWKV
jgi:hypothetical protein